ncbi:Activator of Hsp90 ATPase, N-terminal [Pseudocohnilembus persalinus]|uniref:Activator of Hsp90 ATPase, N-terminal n=1 Tax=Pseudocohnilembus persalinus TaxID=266149 RepID=A0A0V0QAE7_PSEPJ|nr:Activator of Hsp90 ATPase, N-terminal [Pseudocohnilembus persalinus]|eukprot:KRW99213.1 Activator of Hsp90 ATPase, N-terminal [Pseudocohnilembus persalinus]
MQQKQQGAGSLWNPGNWHWESKNYTEIAKKLLEEKIKTIKLEQDGIVIENTEVKSIKGEAEINIRKSKQIFCYDFEVQIEWTAKSQDDVAEGTYTMKDINPFDNDYEIDSIKISEKSGISDQAKKIIQKQMVGKYVETMSHFVDDIMKLEGDPEKIKQVEEARKLDNEKIAQARQSKGEEKEKIFQEQRQKELEFKMKNMEVQQKTSQ